MARALAVLGTGSDVGKSLLSAAVCRLLYRAGVNVAPFKAQNMSLNSFVTPDGGEMGRAQVLQAQACGLAPHVDMNPILLKPEADSRSQVIVHGRVWASHDAWNYFAQKEFLLECVRDSYERLAKQHDVIVIEGAGSAAELNLRERDIVNWPVVEMADARVILVADIDRGGVFAQVIGTLDLLSSAERQRVLGVVINKFRGDLSLFRDGIRILEERTDVPVLGVIPFLRQIELDQEDSVEIDRNRVTPFGADKVNVAVVLVPHMSNFTDFNFLAAEDDVALRYVAVPEELRDVDVIILPGSKSTIADLEYLRKHGFPEALMNHARKGREAVGICGGFQMLGRRVADPYNVEGGGAVSGFGLLDVSTVLSRQKTTRQVRAQPWNRWLKIDVPVSGYEIHMGETARQLLEPCLGVHDEASGVLRADGAMSADGMVWGTYIHGVFDQSAFRRAWLNRVRERKGLHPIPVSVSEGVSRRLANALDRWADHVELHIDWQAVARSVR